MSDLIDTTEMYLRTIFELEEEGITPLRARIAERLGQSGPTVSQTVARMERDGLLAVEGDRHLELSDDGRAMATRVMRKHRLAECLLVDVIGLQWEDVHAEACRWEHVMSETVERRILEILGHPTVSPYGNPIPGPRRARRGAGRVRPRGPHHPRQGRPRRLDPRHGRPHRRADPDRRRPHGRRCAARALSPARPSRSSPRPGGFLVGSAGEYAELDVATASHVFVAKG